MRNIEIKARLTDYQRARSVAQSLATAPVEFQHQRDTYFGCQAGRLKLREIDGATAQLIWYVRPDTHAAKASDYQIVPVAEPRALCAALSAALGTWAVVEKRREIYLVDNVRIHLDRVAGLGEFIELEAVLATDADQAQGRSQVDFLSAKLGIVAEDLLDGSYSDMPGAAPPANRGDDCQKGLS